MRKSLTTDLEQCGKLWNRLMPCENVSDLWAFRVCFQKHFNYKPYFLVLEDQKGVAGMLPLSYVKDLDMFVFFPGEIWKGKTWIERTPVYVREERFLPELLSSCPERTYLRYMECPEEDNGHGLEVDEIGYVLYPPNMSFDLAVYRDRFSNKKFKAIMKVVRSFTDADSAFHLNRLEDFDFLVKMSLDHFGSASYLHDQRFREGFREMMYFLHDKRWLRMISLEIGGKTAAVDIGAMFGGNYTVFLGGTLPEFLGIAKVMNMHHIEFAFKEGFSKIDFLCGDFHWKKLWHLDPEPLYKFVTPALCAEEQTQQEGTATSPGYLREETLFA